MFCLLWLLASGFLLYYIRKRKPAELNQQASSGRVGGGELLSDFLRTTGLFFERNFRQYL